MGRFSEKDVKDMPGNKRVLTVKEATTVKTRPNEWFVKSSAGDKIMSRGGENLTFNDLMFAVDGWIFIPGVTASQNGPVPCINVVHEKRLREQQMKHEYVSTAILNYNCIVEIGEYDELRSPAFGRKNRKEKSHIEQWMEACLSTMRIQVSAQRKVKFLRTLQKAVDHMYQMLNEADEYAAKKQVHVAELQDFGAVTSLQLEDGSEAGWHN